MIREQNLQVADAPNMAYDAVLTAGNFKPILFSTPMIQAILRGEKTQTRRFINPQPIDDSESGYVFDGKHKSLYKNDSTHEDWRVQFISDWCKYKIGDILWVRETFQILPPNMVFYKADTENKTTGNWKPSIFMPKEACRIFLKLKSIRVERLNDISENDSLQEGIQPFTKDNNLFKHGLDGWEWQSMTKYAKEAYKILWQKINGEKSWAQNPFVFVYEFERTDASFACS